MLTNKAEMRQAFEWTCDNCGRDHFARAITPDPESVAEFKDQLQMAQDEGFDGIVCLMMPVKVTCPDCKITYDTVNAYEGEDE